MEDLAVKVRKVHDIEIDESDGADARRSKIERHRRSQSSGADQKHTRFPERALADLSHLRQEDLAVVAHQLFASQLRRVTAPFGIHVGGILRGESTSSSLGR